MERIGVVGVGRMGANMARRLKEVGYPVTAVYDVRAGAATALAAELGCEACDKLARVTALADVIITVVVDDKSMEAIFAGKKDNLLQGAKGKVFINCATVSPETHVKVEKLAKKVGAATLEGCMASSINQARAGTLYLMCAGEKSTFDKLQPILSKLSDDGKLMRYIGTAGKAAQVKALVYMVMNINTAGLAEGLGLGAAVGLDLKMLMEVFSQTGANSRVLVTDGEDMVNRDHSCFFSAAHAAKDSGIALGVAKKAKLNLPLATATYKQFKKMTQVGLGDLDKSGIAELTFKGRGPKGKKKVIKHIAGFWSQTHYPSKEKEWTLDEKVADAKKAGFDGMASGANKDLPPVLKKYGMLVAGYIASGKAAEFPAAVKANKDMGAHHINVQLADEDTLTPEALGLTLLMLQEGKKQGVEPAIEVHRDTCTETPEKTYALADAYQKVTGELLPMTWDFSHLSVVKHLAPSNYIERLITRPDLIQRAQQFHFRPFNGHHCQVPVTDGKGNLTQEVKDWLPFAEAVLKCWLEGKGNKDRDIFVCPEMGPVPGGYNFSTLPNSWEDAKVLRGEIDKIWKKLTK